MFGVRKQANILQTFYYCSTESVLTFSFTCWFHSTSLVGRNRPQSKVKVCSKIIKLDVISLSSLYEQQTLMEEFYNFTMSCSLHLSGSSRGAAFTSQAITSTTHTHTFSLSRTHSCTHTHLTPAPFHALITSDAHRCSDSDDAVTLLVITTAAISQHLYTSCQYAP